jgi:ferredoxin-NADP reductase
MKQDARRRLVRVAARRTVGRGIDEFVLVSEDGGSLAPFAPGAHIDVHPAPGLVRQYSLCGETDDLSRYVIAVLHQEPGRGGSRAVHEQLEVGTTVEIGTPRQNFPLEEQAEHSVLVAGGVGITPILAMARHLHRLGRSFELHYRARSAEHAAYHGELQDAAFAARVSWQR